AEVVRVGGNDDVLVAQPRIGPPQETDDVRAPGLRDPALFDDADTERELGRTRLGRERGSFLAEEGARAGGAEPGAAAELRQEAMRGGAVEPGEARRAGHTTHDNVPGRFVVAGEAQEQSADGAV